MTTIVATVDEYIGMQAEAAQPRLRAAAPQATDVISYGMPTYKLGGRRVHSLRQSAIVRCTGRRLTSSLTSCVTSRPWKERYSSHLPGRFPRNWCATWSRLSCSRSRPIRRRT